MNRQDVERAQSRGAARTKSHGVARIAAVVAAAMLMAPPGSTAAAGPDAADIARARIARSRAAICTTCHNGGAADAAFAALDTRSAADIARDLREFRSGRRSGTVMPQIARGLTDADVDVIARGLAAKP